MRSNIRFRLVHTMGLGNPGTWEVFMPHLLFFWKRLRCRCGKVAKFSKVEDAAAAAQTKTVIGCCFASFNFDYSQVEDYLRQKGTQFDGEA